MRSAECGMAACRRNNLYGGLRRAHPFINRHFIGFHSAHGRRHLWLIVQRRRLECGRLPLRRAIAPARPGALVASSRAWLEDILRRAILPAIPHKAPMPAQKHRFRTAHPWYGAAERRITPACFWKSPVQAWALSRPRSAQGVSFQSGLTAARSVPVLDALSLHPPARTLRQRSRSHRTELRGGEYVFPCSGRDGS